MLGCPVVCQYSPARGARVAQVGELMQARGSPGCVELIDMKVGTPLTPSPALTYTLSPLRLPATLSPLR